MKAILTTLVLSLAVFLFSALVSCSKEEKCPNMERGKLSFSGFGQCSSCEIRLETGEALEPRNCSDFEFPSKSGEYFWVSYVKMLEYISYCGGTVVTINCIKLE